MCSADKNQDSIDSAATTSEIERLYKAVCLVETTQEAEALLADLCTPREIEDFAQRLDVARRLAEGESYVSVSEHTGASSTTVSRVSKCLHGARGGYTTILGRLAVSDQADNEGDF